MNFPPHQSLILFLIHNRAILIRFGNGANEVGNTYWARETNNWLKSRFHFSFAEYSNPDNMNFGVLRVMNDDLVQPDRGFGNSYMNMRV